MLRLVIEGLHGDRVELEAPAGERVLDACDEQSAPVPISCRAGNCGTCRVHVTEGLALLAPPERDEMTVLHAAGAARDERLACQVRIAGSTGVVRLKALFAR